MSLPSPNLDDRAFQDFVDEAKRLLQRRNPDWTDNNVSDPGVTLIETFAYMADQLVYRLNQVPELHYIKFLELLGERLRPPAAAYTTLQFTLAVPQPNDVLVPRGTAVSTMRTGSAPPVTFTTDRDLTLVSLSTVAALSQPQGSGFTAIDLNSTTSLDEDAFSSEPRPGDAFYVGLSKAAAHCIIRLEVDARIEGIGVDPLRPPLVFEAWDGRQWVGVELLSDTTGGFNRKGSIELALDEHQMSNLAGVDAGWIRTRVVETEGDQPAYKESPTVRSVTVATIGGRASATHCQIVSDETLGRTTGTPGETFRTNRAPLTAGQDDLAIELSSPDGWERWNRVETFANHGPDERIFTLDAVTGELRFGPMIRLPDGSVRSFGATPDAGATVRIPEYLTGGGSAGNLDAGELRILRTSIPFVSKVENIVPAVGGVDAEDLEDLKARAAINVRARERAVSASDFELLVQQASPSLVRTRCLTGDELGSPGTVLVLVVPDIPQGRVPFEVLRPRQEILDTVRAFIDKRRLVGTTVRIEPPRYLGVSVVARIALHSGADNDAVLREADAAIADFIHPLTGGYDGKGWPFGRDFSVGDVYGVLQKVPGIAYVDVARLVPIDAVTGERAEPTDRVALKPYDLLFSIASDFEVLDT